MSMFLAKLLKYFLLLWGFLFGFDNERFRPSFCLLSPNLETLVSCLDTFTVPHDYYMPVTYNFAQPFDFEREDWRIAVQTLLSVDGNCSDATVPLSLQSMYTIQAFQGHCILYETASKCGTYVKGWGFAVVPNRRASVSRKLHISAPHPGYDIGTVEQAAAVYTATGANSLLVAGRKRTAFLEQSDCISGTSAKQAYYKTDPAHNNQEPFFDANMVIYNWQHVNYGCPSSSCAFLQFHGKGASTCPTDTIFLSSGLGNSTASQKWYLNSTDRPVKRLAQELSAVFPSFTVSLPSDSPCTLTATKNVVGRHFNGINEENVCFRAATSRTATGEFIHAEQASVARDGTHYAAWSQAVRKTFEPVCAATWMTVNPATQLCEAPKDLTGRPGITVEEVVDWRWESWYSVILMLVAVVGGNNRRRRED